MRRIFQLLVAVLVLWGSVLMFAGLAAADPAQPYNYNTCTTLGDGSVFCEAGHGVGNFNQSASGNTVIHSFDDFTTSRTSSTGQTQYQGSGRYNLAFVSQSDGTTQVYHANQAGQYSYGGTTCTYVDNFTYANGALRHGFSNLQCTP